jgi:co-chaperonin GroES (HSP10)
VYMTRGMQCGRIVAVGDRAADIFPEAQIGQTLLVHHFVESDEKSNCVDSDEQYNYYVVTCTYHNGQNNQTYGVFDGEKIIPHPDYLFLEAPPSLPALTPDEYLDDQLQESKAGLFVFKQWKLDREAIVERIKELKGQIDQLTKPGMRMTREVSVAVREREQEMDRLSQQLNQKKMEIYTVAAINPDFAAEILSQTFFPVNPGDKVFMLNIACETKMEFNNKEYIVAKCQHFCAPYNWVIHAMGAAQKKEAI